MIILSYQEIRDVFEKHDPDIRNIWLFDSKYCALSKKEFESLIKEIEPITIQFENELFDCDDYALVTLAFVKLKSSSLYPYSPSFGEITVRHSISKEIHNLNVLITEDNKRYYFEPQGKLFVSGDNYKPFFARI